MKAGHSDQKKPVQMCIMSTVPVSITAFYGKQIDYLAGKGFAVTVITSPESGLQSKISGKAHLELIPMTRTVSPLQDLVAFFRVLTFMAKKKFDIVQYSSPKAALLGSVSAFLCRVPVRLYLMWGLYYTGQTGMKRQFLRCIEKVICFCSTHVSPDSQGNLRFAVEEKLCLEEKLSVVGTGSANGVDLEKFDPGWLQDARLTIRKELNIPADALVIGFVGRLRREKGINELLLAYRELAQKYPSVYLLLVGPRETGANEFEAESQRLCAENKHILCAGFQENPERFMSAMDIFVLPSYREGFGIVIVEAAAMGLPVVSTDIPGPRDAVLEGKTGILVPARSVQALADAMERLIKNPQLRKDMGVEARLWARNFEQKRHWEAIVSHRRALLESYGCRS